MNKVNSEPLVSVNLEVLPFEVDVIRLDAKAEVPKWALSAEFFTISRTAEELSIIVPSGSAPKQPVVEANWSAIKVAGPLDFSLTGILDALAHPLAKKKVSIFAISTFDTDYLLVKSDKLKHAKEILLGYGHKFIN